MTEMPHILVAGSVGNYAKQTGVKLHGCRYRAEGELNIVDVVCANAAVTLLGTQSPAILRKVQICLSQDRQDVLIIQPQEKLATVSNPAWLYLVVMR